MALVEGGVLLGLRRRGLETRMVPFAELTHVEATRLGVWLATTKSTQVIRRSLFVRDRDPDELVQTIRWRLSEQPGGEARLGRMRAIAERALRPRPRRATGILVALCLAVFALQWLDPFSMQVGVFYPGLVNLGEYWRIATANLMHGLALLPLHLIINMLCLLAFGLLVERPLGAARTFLVMGASGLAAMLASAFAGYQEVLGASGVVAGLVGSVLWLEFNAPADLPAWWRVPRRILIVAVVLQGLLDQALPFIAAAAHLGGLVGGFLATPFAVTGAFEGRPLARPQRIAAAVLTLFLVASAFSAGQLLRRDPGALARHGERLLAVPEINASALNDLAWRMATETDADPEDMAVAVRLAEVAVAKTNRLDPNVLDTLAEVLFLSGDDQAAVSVIDEAITLASGEIYFREQRRRFTGERAADDRPDPPTRWIRPSPTGQHDGDPALTI